MKKFILLFFPLFFLSILSFQMAALVHADEKGQCWYVENNRCITDGYTETSKAAKSCAADNELVKTMINKEGSIYETDTDCKNRTNALKPQPTATPLPTPTPDPNAPPPDPSFSSNGIKLEPTFDNVYDTTKTVTITYNNPEVTDTVYVCLEGDMCIDKDDIRNGISEGKSDSLDRARRGMSNDDVDEGTLQRYKLDPGTHQIVVCGDGDSKLKGSEEKYYQGAEGKEKWWTKMKNHGCENDRDFFHAGKTYVAAFYTKGSTPENQWVWHDVAGFYVNHKAPRISLYPIVGLTPENAHFTVRLNIDKEDLKPNGTNPDKSPRNNYMVLVEGAGYSERRCGAFDENNLSKEIVLPDPALDRKLSPGTVRIYIKEQVNETDDLNDYIGHVLDYKDDLLNIDFQKQVQFLMISGPDFPAIVCQGGFTYRVYTCHISNDSKINRCDTYKIKKPTADNPNHYEEVEYVDDPQRADIKGILAYFDKLGAVTPDSTFPCNIGTNSQKNPSKCKFVDTALGQIPVNPIQFITRIFSIVLSFAGLGALILIILSGYRLMVSRGNKEVIQNARERLTSAIVGLIFIIFSLVLLSLIAYDILKIPGFGV